MRKPDKMKIVLASLLVCSLFLNSCTSPLGETGVTNTTEKEKPKAEIHTVEMAQMKFFPATLNVKKGDKIVFVNRDIVAHNVTEQSKKLWASPDLQHGDDWVFVAQESADYYCTIHPMMKGKIIVE